MPQQTDRVSELEAQVEQLQSELEDVRNYAEAAHRRFKTLQTGLLELQVRELQTGSMLSVDGINEFRLDDELGLDVEYVGDDQEYLRLENPDDVGDEDAMAASLPNAEEMCRLEQLRQVWRRGLMDLEDLGDADTQRAIRVWDNFDTMCSETGTNGKHWRVDSEQVRRLIDKHEDIDSGSLYELARRTMDVMPRLTDGLLRVDKDDTLYLVGTAEGIKDAMKPLYETSTLDGGHNIVVRR